MALNDLADALRARGWTVDVAITTDALGLSGHAPAMLPRWSARRWARLPRFTWLPPDARTLVQHMLLGGGVARAQASAMQALEHRLATTRYDAVIAHVFKPSPGIGHFATRRHPAVLLQSLDGLASELRLAPWLWLARATARLAPGPLHRDLFRPVDPARIRLAVFGSEAWRDEAVRAGAPADRTRVIHFGIPPPPLAPLPESRNRLLWVGRCSPEKGLHVFLDALAELRRTRNATLTAVTGPGTERYRLAIRRQIAELGLGNAVRLVPQVARDQLPDYYRSHDALLFHSAFRDPVALVLLEAYSYGLPVVAPRSIPGAALIDGDDTCVCFETSSAADVAAAAARALDDEALRDAVRRRAHARVATSFSTDAMGQAYDAALDELLVGASGRS